MYIVETINGNFSFSVDAGVTSFVGNDGKNADRQFTAVTIWEHVITGRKFNQLMPIAKGFSLCQPMDEFNFYDGARRALTNALDQIGIGDSPEGSEFHQALKNYCHQNDLAQSYY